MRFCFKKKDFVDKDINPNKLAVIGDNFELNWTQFSERVDNLCNEFITKEFTNLKYPIIVYGHKSTNMMVAFYAMMKLEIPYIPLDINYPKDRILKIIEISKSQLFINTTSSKVEFNKATEVLLKEDKISIFQSNDTLYKSIKEKDPLVYIIFTSGSTGEPKGVQISTEAIQSFSKWMTNDFGFSDNDVFINTAILSFDLSVFEVMTFGGIGGTILLNSKSCTSEPNLFMERIQKYNGTVWVSTPSFALIYSRIGYDSKLASIKTFLFCGEILPHGLAKTLVSNFENARTINTYGPTEATVATTIVDITEEILNTYDPIPVGKPKPECKIIVDNGEIVIVGQHVSVGYLNNPELNKEKFKVIDGQRAFKTGDNGFFKDGMLFFDGRNDDLVKLHGYRIELSEITATINKLSYVLHGETIALKRNGDVKKIVCLAQLYPNFKHKVDSESIKNFIATKLPAYMIPSDIKFVDEIPLNQNGKADKNLLTQIYLQK